MCPKFNSNLYTYHTIDTELEHFIVTGALVQVQRKKKQQQRNNTQTKIGIYIWYILFGCESLWMWFIQNWKKRERKSSLFTSYQSRERNKPHQNNKINNIYKQQQQQKTIRTKQWSVSFEVARALSELSHHFTRIIICCGFRAQPTLQQIGITREISVWYVISNKFYYRIYKAQL